MSSMQCSVKKKPNIFKRFLQNTVGTFFSYRLTNKIFRNLPHEYKALYDGMVITPRSYKIEVMNLLIRLHALDQSSYDLFGKPLISFSQGTANLDYRARIALKNSGCCGIYDLLEKVIEEYDRSSEFEFYIGIFANRCPSTYLYPEQKNSISCIHEMSTKLMPYSFTGLDTKKQVVKYFKDTYGEEIFDSLPITTKKDLLRCCV